ncbi:hypothetical protein tb265_16680 [Gemmatimonadetes bacterium T265]|nr:hypothetical protein tb265_16680 [Gemmatimonadetes bacterium T265]
MTHDPARPPAESPRLASPRLWSLGSGSKGNAIVLAHAGHHLMFDAGFELPVLVERLRAAGLHPWDVDDVVLSHGHRDHVVGAAAGARIYGWRVWGALGTVWRWRALREIPLRPFEPGDSFAAGPWTVHTTPVPHDVDDAAAFLAVADGVPANAGLRVGYATDLGRAPDALVDLFRGASALVLESNHDRELLRTGPYPPDRQARVGGEHGHLSNDRAAAVLRAVAHPGLAQVVLAHVSRHNNTPALALASARAALDAAGYDGALHAAPQDTLLGPLDVAPLAEAAMDGPITAARGMMSIA